MKVSVRQPPSSLQSSAWRREDAEDTARWEAQLQHMRKQEDHRKVPLKAYIQPIVRTTLEIANIVTLRDNILIARALPVLTGDDEENLICGSCSGIIGARISKQSARRLYPDGVGLFVRCICATFNMLYRIGTLPKTRC